MIKCPEGTPMLCSADAAANERVFTTKRTWQCRKLQWRAVACSPFEVTCWWLKAQASEQKSWRWHAKNILEFLVSWLGDLETIQSLRSESRGGYCHVSSFDVRLPRFISIQYLPSIPRATKQQCALKACRPKVLPRSKALIISAGLVGRV